MAFIGDDDDDDLEDERGEREYESKPLSGFQGIQGWPPTAHRVGGRSAVPPMGGENRHLRRWTHDGDEK